MKWATHPTSLAAIALMTRLDNVALAKAASDAGRPALDPLQEEFVAFMRPEFLADPEFRQFLGNFMRRMLENEGYRLVEAGAKLPPERRIFLESAAVYVRALRIALEELGGIA